MISLIGKLYTKKRSRTAMLSANDEKKDWMKVKPIIFTENPIIDNNMSTETLLEEFEPVAVEKFEFANWQKRDSNWASLHSQPIQNSLQKIMKEIVGYICHLTSESTNPSIQTLIEKFKALLIENNELEYRNTSKLMAYLQPLANQNSNCDVKQKFHNI